MKILILIGLVAALFGAYLLTRDSFGAHRNSVRVGGFEASVQDQREYPKWVGLVALGGGALLVGAGLRRRKT